MLAAAIPSHTAEPPPEPVGQQAYLKSRNPALTTGFRASTSVWGRRVAVGQAAAETVEIFVDGSEGWTLEAHVVAPNEGNGFANEVALSDDILVVGVPGDDSDATGVNGDGDNLNAQDTEAFR